MQLVKATRDALLRPLQVVSGIVERRQTLPILANVLVRKDGRFVPEELQGLNPENLV